MSIFFCILIILQAKLSVAQAAQGTSYPTQAQKKDVIFSMR